MQAIEFESIINNHTIPVPDSVTLASGTPVRVVVIFGEARADPSIAEFYGCLPDFPEREPQGEYEQRLEVE